MVCNSTRVLNSEKFTFLDLQMQEINAATFKRSAYVTQTGKQITTGRLCKGIYV